MSGGPLLFNLIVLQIGQAPRYLRITRPEGAPRVRVSQPNNSQTSFCNFTILRLRFRPDNSNTYLLATSQRSCLPANHSRSLACSPLLSTPLRVNDGITPINPPTQPRYPGLGKKKHHTAPETDRPGARTMPVGVAAGPPSPPRGRPRGDTYNFSKVRKPISFH